MAMGEVGDPEGRAGRREWEQLPVSGRELGPLCPCGVRSDGRARRLACDQDPEATSPEPGDRARRARAAKFVIANSERTRRDVIERVGVPEGRVVRVYYGVDAARFLANPTERREARWSLGWTDDRSRVAFVGALTDRRKGFDWRTRPGEASARGRPGMRTSWSSAQVRSSRSGRRALRGMALETECRSWGFGETFRRSCRLAMH